MFGMAARAPLAPGAWLVDGPRSLRTLSAEHCDGRAIADLASASFLFATPTQLFAHRAGRSLWSLARTDATLVASEPLTDEPWREVAEGALVIADASGLAALEA